MINFGSVDNPAVVKVLNRLTSGLRIGEIQPIQTSPPEDSTCEHCGQIVMRESPGQAWKHYPTLKEECHPRPTASPKRDAAGNVVPLTGK
jgi:hypothetical protein